MRLLLDSNIFLEVLLGQARADEARRLLAKTEEHTFFLSAFSFHSIALILIRHKAHDLLQRFISDTVLSGSVQVVSLSPPSVSDAVTASSQFGLDFDDAYQYVVARENELFLVSYDRDFDRTDLTRKTPSIL